MSLDYFVKLEMLIGRALPLNCYSRNSRVSHNTSTLAPKFDGMESSCYSMWGLLQEKVHKRCIADLDELK